MSDSTNLEKNPKVSVIIPFYNTEDFIQLCIESVQNQTCQDFEIICVDDGSPDKSVDIVRQMMITDDRIRLIQIENHGQGYARNLALNQALGEYILFLDSDDWIEPVTIEVAVKRIEEDDSDIAVFDWKYYTPLTDKSNYVNIDSFFSKNKLIGDECFQLLRMRTLYSVPILYRKSFLEKHEVKYIEGYIYEDTLFLVKVILNSKVVSIISSPLYRITIQKKSSTRVNLSSDWHSSSFIFAVNSIIKYVNSSNACTEEIYYLYFHLLEKFILYYFERTPHKYKSKFLRDFLRNYAKIRYFPDLGKSRFLTFCLKNEIFNKEKYFAFKAGLTYLKYLKPWGRKIKNKFVKILKGIKRKEEKVLKGIMRKFSNNKYQRKPYQFFLKQPLYTNTIVFFGFDYRYSGNSRYLFDEMIKSKNRNQKIFFVTNDPMVPFEYRIAPNSERCDRFMARSKIVIFETWIPAKYKKRDGALWIQLWHGTPIKKMLFDSNEKYIAERNPGSKNAKYNDIQNWDYLISDNPNVNYIFETAFLFPRDRIIACGYPRVRYLLQKKDDILYCNNLKKKIGVSLDKKVILYMPTWRDYNYKLKSEDYDLSYLLNLRLLQTQLGESYEIVYKDHPFISAPQNVNFKNYCNEETQELLLIADFLITDYSSVLFDALAINLPIILYCQDFEKNEEARGVYHDIWKMLKMYRCDSEMEIKSLIEKYVIDDNYKKLKEEFSYRSENGISLSDFIQKFFK